MSIVVVKNQIHDLLKELQAFMTSSESWSDFVGDASFDALNDVDYEHFLQLFAGLSTSVENAFNKGEKILSLLSKEARLNDKIRNNSISVEDLEAMASLADEFDVSGHVKKADLLDAALIALSEKQENLLSQAAESDNFEKLKKEYLDREKEEKYDKPREILSEINKTKGLGEKYSQKMKEKQYRPMQHALNTRYCPDHPGIGVLFLSEGRYQCSMDKKIYDFKNGYTTLDGDKVPGGSVDMQNREFLDHLNNRVNYDTRENRTKQ